MLLARINVLYFVSAFAVGLLFCYVFSPPPHVVIKFPSPSNAEKYVYRDSSDTCFKIKAQKTDCPRDKSHVKPQPLTEDYTSDKRDT